MKKGFTLIELLAVIVILAVILVIAIPQVLKVVDNSRISAYIKNEQMVLKAVDLYVSRNTGELPGEIGSTTEVSINYLVSNGMLTEIKNPYNKNEECNGYVTITKLSDTEYDYTPHLRCGLDIHDSSEDGLVGHWKLHGNAIDYSNNNNGVINGAIPTENRLGNEGKALAFNGSNNFVGFPSSVQNQLNGRTEATLSMWVKLNNGNPSVATSGIIQLSGFANTNGNLYPYQGDKLYLDVFRNNRLGPILFPDIDLTEWHHLVVTSKPGENGWILYINGEILRRSYGLSLIHTNYMTFRIGNNSSSRWLNGSLSDLKLFNRSLSEHEVKMLYETTK